MNLHLTTYQYCINYSPVFAQNLYARLPKDIPDDIELHYLETPRPNGPYGAAGCGEAPLDAPHPAILNAIYNATGARITRVPALPEVVLAALAELK